MYLVIRNTGMGVKFCYCIAGIVCIFSNQYFCATLLLHRGPQLFLSYSMSLYLTLYIHTCDNESEFLPITQHVSALYFSSDTHFAAKSANSTRISCQILVNVCVHNWLERCLCSWASLAFYNVCGYVLTIHT